MKILISILCTISLLFIINPCEGQYSVQGILKAENSAEAVDFASVYLLDSVGEIAKKTMSDEEGKFTFDQVAEGRYALKASRMGMIPYQKNEIIVSKGNVNLGNLMVTLGSVLQEVTIRGEKALMQMQGDKKIFNVNRSLMADVGTAEDILKQVPSVTVDNNGNLSLRGKGDVTILIDGKPSTIFGNETSDIIQQLPAGSIEQIEVMTNPSSRYDAQGMSGVINIILKKTNNKVDNGSISLGYGTGQRFNGGINYNMTRNKTSFGFNFNSRNDNKDDYDQTWRTVTQPFTSSYAIEDHQKRRFRNFLNITFQQILNNTDEFSAGLSGSLMQVKNKEMNTAQMLNTMSAVDSILYRDLPLHVKMHSIGFTTAYKHYFKSPKKSITISENFNNFVANRSQNYYTQKFDAVGNQLGVDTAQLVSGMGNSINNIVQVDYSNKELGKYEMDAGGKFQYNNFKSDANATKNYLDTSFVDPLLSNTFDYDQNIYAIYALLNRNWDKRWSTQLGLRLESFAYNGTASSYSEKIRVEYLNLFPTAFVSYNMNDENSFQLNYAKRVNRPNFFDIFPFYNISDPLNIRVGNPNLKPEFIHLVEFTYNYHFKKGHQLLATLYTQYTTDLIQRIRTFNADGTSLLKPYNLNSSLTYGLDFTQIFKLNKKSEWMINVNTFNTHIDGNNVSAYTSNTGFSWFAKSLFTYSLPKDFKIQWTINYFGKTVQAQGTRQPYGYTDIAIKKSILQNKLSFTLVANDILNTNRVITNYDVSEVGLTQKINAKPNSQYVQLSVTWNFLKSDGGSKPKGGSKPSKVNEPSDRNVNFKGGAGSSEE